MTVSGSTISSTYLPTGTYKVNIHSSTYGFAVVTPSTVTIAQSSQTNNVISVSAVTSTSFVGGKQITINGGGFVTNNVVNN